MRKKIGILVVVSLCIPMLYAMEKKKPSFTMERKKPSSSEIPPEMTMFKPAEELVKQKIQRRQAERAAREHGDASSVQQLINKISQKIAAYTAAKRLPVEKGQEISGKADILAIAKMLTSDASMQFLYDTDERYIMFIEYTLADIASLVSVAISLNNPLLQHLSIEPEGLEQRLLMRLLIWAKVHSQDPAWTTEWGNYVFETFGPSEQNSIKQEFPDVSIEEKKKRLIAAINSEVSNYQVSQATMGGEESGQVYLENLAKLLVSPISLSLLFNDDQEYIALLEGASPMKSRIMGFIALDDPRLVTLIDIPKNLEETLFMRLLIWADDQEEEQAAWRHGWGSKIMQHFNSAEKSKIKTAFRYMRER